jgi:RNA polymerase sigma-70 factor (ECF subfamily)
MEDYQIVDLYWARSESAIAETEQKYGRMLTGISVALVPTAQDAEECVSDTYLAAWNRMPDERPIYLGAFLSKIVRRISIDRFRSARAEKRGGAQGLIEELTDCIPSDCNLQADYDNRRLAEALNRFLRELDEEKRYVFVRRYYYSDSISEVAKRVGVGEGKVKTVLFRVRGELRKFLEKEGFAI